MVDFDKMVSEAKKSIQIIICNPKCFAFSDFGDAGNTCYNPLVFNCENDKKEDALWHAAVKFAMPHGSYTHRVLAPIVARELGAKFVTYDWLIKIIGRIVSSGSGELETMVDLSK